MEHTTRWTALIDIYEHDDEHTAAEVHLLTNDGNQLVGRGSAKRNPNDTHVPEIGDELAVARALGDLSRRLLRMTAEDIEAVTSLPAHLHT